MLGLLSLPAGDALYGMSVLPKTVQVGGQLAESWWDW